MVDNTRGILAMSAAVVVFIFNDMLIKLAADDLPHLVGSRSDLPDIAAGCPEKTLGFLFREPVALHDIG